MFSKQSCYDRLGAYIYCFLRPDHLKQRQHKAVLIKASVLQKNTVVSCRNTAAYTFLLSVVSPASKHDLRILEENISESEAPVVAGEKAYISKKLQGKEITTPKKEPRGRKLSHTEQAENKRISKTRQVIESSFA